MKLEQAYRHFRAFKVGISKNKVSGNFSDYEERLGCKKVKKKKKKEKFFLGRFPLRFFFISDDKKGGKSKWFCLFP